MWFVIAGLCVKSTTQENFTGSWSYHVDMGTIFHKVMWQATSEIWSGRFHIHGTTNLQSRLYGFPSWWEVFNLGCLSIFAWNLQYACWHYFPGLILESWNPMCKLFHLIAQPNVNRDYSTIIRHNNYQVPERSVPEGTVSWSALVLSQATIKANKTKIDVVLSWLKTD